MKKITNVISSVVLMVLLIILGLLCHSKYIRKDAVVKLGKYGFLIVVSNSMEPTIEEKELIIIKECEEYNLEDIVTYLDSDSLLITHRIKQIDVYNFIARGDNNAVSDSNTKINQIQGKVVYHSKLLGIFVVYYLKFVLLICIVLWFIGFFWTKTAKGGEV